MNTRQIALARHALGFQGSGNKRSYRNRFYISTGSPDFAAWESMLAAGDAERHEATRVKTVDGEAITEVIPDQFHFSMTRQGAEKALGPGEGLCPEDFPVADPA